MAAQPERNVLHRANTPSRLEIYRCIEPFLVGRGKAQRNRLCLDARVGALVQNRNTRLLSPKGGLAKAGILES